jgi:glutathione peroxidase
VKNRTRFTLGMLSLALGIMFATLFVNRIQAEDQVVSNPKVSTEQSYLDYPIETIRGDTTTLRDYEGKVVLVVNVASHCGFTPQYEGLEELYQTYGEKGFVVLGFPANNFLEQEPGTNADILEFCTTNYNVTFPVMAKISVKGNDMHPVYDYLTNESARKGAITWNFNKYLLDKKGNVVARFESKDTPLGSYVEEMIQEML